jgi:hypothetical protein
MVSTESESSEKYSTKSSTEASVKPVEETKQWDQTTSGQIGYYDKSKPYRVIIKAKEIKQ